MGTNDETGYPYLQLAVRLGVPYGHVLSYAVLVGAPQSFWSMQASYELTYAQKHEICQVAMKETRRQRSVTYTEITDAV